MSFEDVIENLRKELKKPITFLDAELSELKKSSVDKSLLLKQELTKIDGDIMSMRLRADKFEDMLKELSINMHKMLTNISDQSAQSSLDIEQLRDSHDRMIAFINRVDGELKEQNREINQRVTAANHDLKEMKYSFTDLDRWMDELEKSLEQERKDTSSLFDMINENLENNQKIKKEMNNLIVCNSNKFDEFRREIEKITSEQINRNIESNILLIRQEKANLEKLIHEQRNFIDEMLGDLKSKIYAIEKSLQDSSESDEIKNLQNFVDQVRINTKHIAELTKKVL